MSNPNAQQAEPTMEEILASIRRIISEEAPEAKVAEAAPLPQPEPQPLAEPEEDILDLTDMVADAPAPEPVFAPQVATPPAPMPEPVVQQAVYTPPTPSMPATPPAPAPLVAANESDIVLNLGKIIEPCPLGFTPTASAAAMLALSDALALTAMELRGFTKEDFALRHHGGYLGKKSRE